MAGKQGSVNINIIANATKAVEGFKDAQTAGEKMAALINRSADKIDASLKNTEGLAEQLATALGPDFRTTIGQNITDIATQFDKAGISADDFRQNSTELIAALRRVEDQADQTASQTRRIGDEADNSRSVMANFAGNAVQELPIVAGAFGPLNMAISQFVEYASEGNIQFKNMATMAVPMAGMAIVMKSIGDASKKLAEANQKIADIQDAYTKSIREGKSKLEAYSAQIADAEGLTFKIMNTTADAAGALQSLGLNADDAAKLMAGGKDDIQAWYDAIRTASPESADAAKLAADAMSQNVDVMDRAATSAEITSKFLGNMAEDTKNVIKPTSDLRSATEKLDDAWQHLRGTWDLQDARQSALNALGDVQQSVNDQKRAVADYIEQLGKIPPELATSIFTAIDQRDLDTAIAKLGQIEWMWTRLGGASVIRDTRGAPSRGPMGYAAGTVSASPGWAVVGENGPELIQMRGGERVANRGDLPGLTGPGGMGNVIINMPSGTNGDQVVRSLERWARRRGSIPVATTSVARR